MNSKQTIVGTRPLIATIMLASMAGLFAAPATPGVAEITALGGGVSALGAAAFGVAALVVAALVGLALFKRFSRAAA